MIETTKGPRREVTLPAAALVDLLDAAGGGAAGALRERGRAAGRLMAERLRSPQDQGTAPRALPATVFWKRIGEVFAARGWGTLAHAPGAAGVGELRSSDWIEADRPRGRSGCEFTTGVLQGLLEEVSGAKLEVEEAECRAAGARSCSFRFGSPAALAAARSAASVARP
jgi:predicted hydrocarbon binding protein